MLGVGLLLLGAAALAEEPAGAAFSFAVDWSSGNASSTLPHPSFSVRKLEAFVYPADGKTYAYADIVNYTDLFYPVSYSSEVGVFSSPVRLPAAPLCELASALCRGGLAACSSSYPDGTQRAPPPPAARSHLHVHSTRRAQDGMTGWVYHGIVVPRGKPGDWDGAGIASPGAAVAADGTVIIGWAGENSPSGGINRQIGTSTAPHPLGPFTKGPVVASAAAPCTTAPQPCPEHGSHTYCLSDPASGQCDRPSRPTCPPCPPSAHKNNNHNGVCGGSGRCDDVIMQSRPDGVHLYHSVKGSNSAAGCDNKGTCIRHRMTKDGGKTWGESTIVLTRKGQMETFA